jgi:bifunctional polynucleotide phosphatase/kinase
MSFQEYFLGLNPAPYTLPGFSVTTLPPRMFRHNCRMIVDLTLVVPAYTPTSTPVVPLAALSLSAEEAAPELCLFVGPPASGKTRFYTQHFRDAGYEHVNQDTLGSRPKCVKAVEAALAAGKSVVVGACRRLGGAGRTRADASARQYE